MTRTGFLLARIADYERAIEEVTSTYFDAPMSEAEMWADVEAKRRIVELHAVKVRREWVNPLDGPAYQEDEFSCAICDWFPSGEGCETIKALTLPYTNHPDYREEWRP